MHALVAALGLAQLAAPALARDVHGVALPETVEVAGRTLHLNGAGVRRRFFVDVYVIGLWVERPSTERRAILDADSPRRIEIHLLRDVSAEQMGGAVTTAFRASAGDAMPSLEERLARLQTLLRAAHAGDTTTLTWIPGRGTVVADDGHEAGTIEGKDFADALFSVWIGTRPVDGGLARALLAGGKVE